ncbi:MAG: helix-hairpin-helix domain-containing protein [Eubacterium sp.]|nr:helix-hairpin-helix domain-containing protein [Eubacterium sp.]
MQIKKLNIEIKDILKRISRNLAGSLMKYGIIIILFFTAACSKDDITIETIRDDTSVASDKEVSEQESSDMEESPKEASDDASESEITTGSNDSVYVYICGAVVNEGVYKLPSDSRVVDAVNKAGGMNEDACQGFVNLAEKLSDGEKIYIPTAEEIESEDIRVGINSFESISSSENSSSEDSVSEDGRVNINRATKQELMTLSGIGESKAEDIISYREASGGFNSIQELTNVNGIGTATFDKLKDKIKVD